MKIKKHRGLLKSEEKYVMAMEIWNTEPYNRRNFCNLDRLDCDRNKHMLIRTNIGKRCGYMPGF